MMRIRHEENFLRNYDSVVGDATILADRPKIVEFTQPYAESRLSMIVPAKTEESAWRFMKPCTWEMWVVGGDWCHLGQHKVCSLVPGAPKKFRIQWPSERSD